MFPSIKQFILSEVINATIEHAGGNAGKKNYQKSSYNVYEREMFSYYREELKGKRINEKIEEAISELIKPEPGSAYGESWINCDLYDIIDGGPLCPGLLIAPKSIVPLPSEVIARVQKKILPSLTEKQEMTVKSIGKLMRKYIEEDLKHIKQVYSW